VGEKEKIQLASHIQQIIGIKQPPRPKFSFKREKASSKQSKETTPLPI